MFRSFGLPEIIIILVIVLIIFGAGKLPQIGGALGKSIREFRKAKNSLDEEEEKLKGETTAKEMVEIGTKSNQS